MPPTSLAVQVLKGPFAILDGDDLNVVAADPDTDNGNSFRCTGRELVLIINTTGSPLSFDVTSVVDNFGRDGDIVDYEVPSDTIAILTVGLTNAKGWKQTDGTILIDVTGTGGKIAVVRLPE